MHRNSWVETVAVGLVYVLLLAPMVCIHRAMAMPVPDDPPPIVEGPLAGDFITDTMITMHATLFGSAPVDEQTAFYYTSEAIDCEGVYGATNNLDQALTLEVIRHEPISSEHFTEENGRDVPPDTEIGVIWATASTAVGSVNIIAFSVSRMSATRTGNQQVTGFVPLVLHDALVDY